LCHVFGAAVVLQFPATDQHGNKNSAPGTSEAQASKQSFLDRSVFKLKLSVIHNATIPSICSIVIETLMTDAMMGGYDRGVVRGA
jgi:hypothetical protein